VKGDFRVSNKKSSKHRIVILQLLTLFPKTGANNARLALRIGDNVCDWLRFRNSEKSPGRRQRFTRRSSLYRPAPYLVVSSWL